MDLLDAIILACIAFFAYSGWRRGISWVGLSLIGLILGVVAGTFAAPRLAGFLSSDKSLHPTLTTGLFFAIILVVQGIGTAIGFRFRLASLRTSFAEADSMLGSIAAVVGVLLTTWYLGITFNQSRWTYVNNQINGSLIVNLLARVDNAPPAFIAKIEQAISGNDFPNPFAGLNPIGLPDVAIPPSADTPGIRDAANNTAQVISYIPDTRSCAGAEAGSGFAATPDYLVTNAHVVAAGTRFVVNTPDGRSHSNVTVVFFDPEADVAILHVPDLGLKPLTIINGDPGPRTEGAVIGYPGGGRETVEPAAVRGSESATGWDIYVANQVTRDIVVVAGKIIPGNSGGPLVNKEGSVIGLVFAESTQNPGREGYALSIKQIASDLQTGVTKTRPVETGPCTSD